jgi:hypothetical protein
MAITGSTRMQATSIQLCVMLTVPGNGRARLLEMDSADVPRMFLEKLDGVHAALKSPELLAATGATGGAGGKSLSRRP